MPVQSGVCQGTILGPYLSNVIVDNIFAASQLSTGANIIMYADDLCYIKQLCNAQSELELQLDADQQSTLYWNIGLRFNPAKSQALLVSAATQNQNHASVNISIDGTKVELVESLSYLGIILDSHLYFGLQVRTAATNAKKQLGALFRAVGRWVPSATFL